MRKCERKDFWRFLQVTDTTDKSAWLRLPAAQPFYEALLDLGEAGRWDPVDMLTLIAGECDLILMRRPNAHGYQGLTQIGRRELVSLGWREAEMGPFCLAPPETQIVYSAKYFEEWRRRLGFERWKSAGHLWAANLAPAHSKRLDGVVYSELEHPVQYRANRWLDLNGDRVIHRDELTAALAKSVKSSIGRYTLATESLAVVVATRSETYLRDYTPNLQSAAGTR